MNKMIVYTEILIIQLDWFEDKLDHIPESEENLIFHVAKKLMHAWPTLKETLLTTIKNLRERKRGNI